MMRSLCFLLGAVGLSILFCGCTESEDVDKDLLPDNGLLFWMYPNDAAISDSITTNLAHGTKLVVHPGASYEVSFDADTAAGAPVMQLFKLKLDGTGENYFVSRIRKLKASLENGRYVYRFVSSVNDASELAVTLEKNDTYYTGSTQNVRFTGEGIYSDHLSLNLVLVGNVAKKLDGFTVEELADGMLARFRKFYTGIVIDTIFVNHAENHPKSGFRYPANEPWVAGRNDGDEMMQALGGDWPGAENALDIVLVHYIDANGLMGYSYLFSGNLGGGEGSTVVLGANVKTANGSLSNSMNDIIETAVHESGHFLGLRHTTSTYADMYGEYVYDHSVKEDGISDTPFCKGLAQSGLAKEKALMHSDMKFRGDIWGRVKAVSLKGLDIYACPDVDNLMFPVETEVEYIGLTQQQQDLVRKTLMIYPH